MLKLGRALVRDEPSSSCALETSRTALLICRFPSNARDTACSIDRVSPEAAAVQGRAVRMSARPTLARTSPFDHAAAPGGITIPSRRRGIARRMEPLDTVWSYGVTIPLLMRSTARDLRVTCRHPFSREPAPPPRRPRSFPDDGPILHHEPDARQLRDIPDGIPLHGD